MDVARPAPERHAQEEGGDRGPPWGTGRRRSSVGRRRLLCSVLTMSVVDALDRPLRTMRLSVTDRCNLRCRYCMPNQRYVWLPRSEVLSFDELHRLVGVLVRLGVARLRLTGGEPLLRRDLPGLVELLATEPGLEDLALTTNGLLLARQARNLRDAGLHRLTVSLDTLRHDRFVELTRVDGLGRVLDGIAAAKAAGFGRIKLDAVILRGQNDDELANLLEFARDVDAEMRFVEYMSVGGAPHWRPERAVAAAEMLAAIEDRFGPATPLGGRGAAPATRYRLSDGLVFGIIASNTTPFCQRCDRGRLTADGMWYRCLHARRGLDLKAPLRGGATDDELLRMIEQHWSLRHDRGAADRAAIQAAHGAQPQESPLADPHLEMHTRGG